MVPRGDPRGDRDGGDGRGRGCDHDRVSDGRDCGHASDQPGLPADIPRDDDAHRLRPVPDAP